jgi:hypothetical protein
MSLGIKLWQNCIGSVEGVFLKHKQMIDLLSTMLLAKVGLQDFQEI